MKKNVKAWLKRGSPTILTFVGAVGVVVTSIMAVRATPQSYQVVKRSRDRKRRELN